MYLIKTLHFFYLTFHLSFFKIYFFIHLCQASFLEKPLSLPFSHVVSFLHSFCNARESSEYQEKGTRGFKTSSCSRLTSFRGCCSSQEKSQPREGAGLPERPQSQGKPGSSSWALVGQLGGLPRPPAPHPHPVWAKEKGEGRDFYQIFPEGRGLHPLEFLPHG